MAMNENTKKIFKFLKDNHGDYMTAKDVAAALGMTPNQVNCTFTTVVQRKNLGERVEKTVAAEDGTQTTVKFLVLNDAGMAFDLDAEA